MDGREFANLHAGESWHITQSSIELIAVVRGYFIDPIHKALVVISPWDEYKRKAAGPINNYEVRLLPENEVVRCLDVRAAGASNAEIHEYYFCTVSCFMSRVIPSGPIYPNTCKKCRMPARVVKNAIFCSNTKCKSWRSIKKNVNGRPKDYNRCK